MANLTESLAVNVDTVWIEKDGIELEVPFGSLTEKTQSSLEPVLQFPSTERSSAAKEWSTRFQ